MILSRTLTTGPRLPRRAGLAALVRWLVAVDARHRDARAFARLDDRLLRDIGLVAARPPRRRP